MATAEEGVIICGMVRNATLAILLSITLAAPLAAGTAVSVVAKNTRKILGSPRLCSMALKRNVKSARVMRRRTYPLPGPAYRRRRRVGVR